MDQLKEVGDFVWKYRFWFSVGFVALFAMLVHPMGVSALQDSSKQKMNQLNSVYNNAKGYTSGKHPNEESKILAKKLQEVTQEEFQTLWKKLYDQQKDLFTWPEEVREKFQGKKFFSNLKDEKNEDLKKYLEAYNGRAELDSVISEVDYLRIDTQKKKLIGKIELNPDIVVEMISFWGVNQLPHSFEAWLTQETLWIYRSIFKAINQANQSATSWFDAPIRNIQEISIGIGALDGQSIAKKIDEKMKNEVLEAMEENKSIFISSTSNRIPYPVRYYNRTEQFREIPVFIEMLVDEKKVPEILTTMCAADFHFTILSAQMGIPDKVVTIPEVIQKAALIDRDVKIIPSTHEVISLKIWGKMRIYFKPNEGKEKQKNQKN